MSLRLISVEPLMSDVPVNETTEDASSGAIPEREMDTIAPQVPAGAQLAALREARGWTTAQIASQLNLANRQIQALESDNYAALPGMVIVRGFIRAYAKVLQTDPAPILAAIVDDTLAPAVLLPERNTLSASFSETKLSPSGSRGFSFKLMVGVAVLAILGVALFAAQNMGWIPASASSQSAKSGEKLIPLEPVEAATEAPAAQPEIIETTVTPAPAEASASVAVPVAKPAAPLPVAATPSKPVVVAPAVDKEAVALPLNSKDALAIRVREDSWVEIKRADNTVLVSRLFKAGSSELLAINGPVSMVIGNAAGVDVVLRGTPVDVVAGNTSNVARLNLK
jgi:cytoskeleton protein RodZ